MPNID